MAVKMTIEIPEGAEGADLLRRISEILNPQSPTTGGASKPLEIVNQKYTPENNPGRRREDIIDLEDLDIDKLKKASFSNNTIAMIANKVLGINDFRTNSKETEARSRAWFQRPITEPYKALYIGITNTPPIGQRLNVVGLSESNKLSYLMFTSDLSIQHACKNLAERGLRASAVKLAVCGSTVGLLDAVEDCLPKAELQMCWESIMRAAPAGMRPKIKDLMGASSLPKVMNLYNKFVKSSPDLGKFIKPHIQELTTFYHFDEDLWRVLKTLKPIYRFETENRRKLRTVSTDEEARLISTWTALRLQYHWQKIAVDAAQLSNLKYMKHSSKEI